MLGELLSFGTGLLNNVFANERQEDAQNFSAQQFATRYQTSVKDMQAAGLNPMLAYSQGAGSQPSSSAASATMPDVGATHLQSKLNSAQIANIQADTANKEAQAFKIRAETQAALGSAQASVANASLADNTALKVGHEIENVKTQGQVLAVTVSNLLEQNELLKKQGVETDARIRNLNETLIKLRQENKITAADLKAIADTGGVGRIAREIKPLSDIGSDWLSPGKWWTNKSSSTSSSTSVIKHVK